MNTPLFSVITVVLNPGEGLGRTVESIKAQRCRDFEHIIKDAGSIDGSVQRYSKPAKEYNPIVIIKPDRGIYDAMNQALDYASGKYVLFLNAGDLLYADDVLDQVAQVVIHKPDLGLVYGDYFYRPLQMVVKSPKRLTGFFLYRTMICHQSCFVMRKQINAIGQFDTSFQVVADYDLLLRLVLGAGVSYQYLGKTLSSCFGGGFSAQNNNVMIGAQEVQRLRLRHYRPICRLLYGFLRAATLPGMRIRLMQSSRFLFMRKIYTRAVNVWNK